MHKRSADIPPNKHAKGIAFIPPKKQGNSSIAFTLPNVRSNHGYCKKYLLLVVSDRDSISHREIHYRYPVPKGTLGPLKYKQRIFPFRPEQSILQRFVPPPPFIR